MKFTVNKQEIQEAVMNLQRIVPSRATSQALEGILFQAEVNSLTMSAYSMEIGMRTSITSSVEESGKAVLSAKLISDIVIKAPDDIITISIDDKNLALITSGQSTFNIAGCDPTEFPELPVVNTENSFVMDAETMKSVINQTLFAISTNDKLPIQKGSLFSIENGNLDVVSVDGYRLALRHEKIDLDQNMSFIVPGKTLSEVAKLIKTSPVVVSPEKRFIMFKIDNYTIISSLMQGEFLNYRASISTESKTELTVNCQKFIDSLDRMSLLINDRATSPIKIIFKEDDIRLSVFTPLGRANDRIPCILKGDEVEIGFNGKFLLEALRNTECDEVRISLNGSTGPMIMKPKEGDSFLFIVLPVKMKSE
jgi:DNA polymerase-3 subunit beta